MSTNLTTPPEFEPDISQQGVALWHSPLVLIDVESVGLHGEGFAVAWLCTRAPDWPVLDEGMHACSPQVAAGTSAGRAWVAAHVPTLPVDCQDPAEVRGRFWSRWLAWRQQGFALAGDCVWPVEANFLSACVRQSILQGDFDGPYPLLDVASLRAMQMRSMSSGLDRHDPRADVRRTWQDLQSLVRLA